MKKSETHKHIYLSGCYHNFLYDFLGLICHQMQSICLNKTYYTERSSEIRWYSSSDEALWLSCKDWKPDSTRIESTIIVYNQKNLDGISNELSKIISTHSNRCTKKKNMICNHLPSLLSTDATMFQSLIDRLLPSQNIWENFLHK